MLYTPFEGRKRNNTPRIIDPLINRLRFSKRLIEILSHRHHHTNRMDLLLHLSGGRCSTATRKKSRIGGSPLVVSGCDSTSYHGVMLVSTIRANGPAGTDHTGLSTCPEMPVVKILLDPVGRTQTAPEHRLGRIRRNNKQLIRREVAKRRYRPCSSSR